MFVQIGSRVWNLNKFIYFTYSKHYDEWEVNGKTETDSYIMARFSTEEEAKELLRMIEEVTTTI